MRDSIYIGSSVHFIGIDLAWQSERNPTGAAVLARTGNGVSLLEVSPPLYGLAEVQKFVEKHEVECSCIAIDAPLIIQNATGMRDCERAVGSRYGNRSASCHSSNLKLYPSPASVALADWLATRGFAHPGLGAGSKVMIEVYPHAAFVAFFDLKQIIKYKKGRVAVRAAGLKEVQQTLCRLKHETPALLATPLLDEILSTDTAGLKGRGMKSFEDGLDAIFCAYLAAYYYQWGLERFELFGNLSDGYIANPALRLNA